MSLTGHSTGPAYRIVQCCDGEAESDRRAEAMLERLVRGLREASAQANKSAATATSAQAKPGFATKTHSWSQPTQSAQRTWADITRAGTQSAAGWATVVNRKKKLKKHPLDQRRILFSRDSRMHHCDIRAKCANCGGAHVATSRKCPKRVSSRQKSADDLQDMRSSPPLVETGSDKEDSSRMERQEEMDTQQLDLEQSRLRQETTIMSDMSVDDSLPDG